MLRKIFIEIACPGSDFLNRKPSHPVAATRHDPGMRLLDTDISDRITRTCAQQRPIRSGPGTLIPVQLPEQFDPSIPLRQQVRYKWWPVFSRIRTQIYRYVNRQRCGIRPAPIIDGIGRKIDQVGGSIHAQLHLATQLKRRCITPGVINKYLQSTGKMIHIHINVSLLSKKNDVLMSVKRVNTI